jgi:hypothetical protein
MKFVHGISALTLVAYSGLAVGQTTPITPTYYPQCWFWQLPTTADVSLVQTTNIELPHT